MRMAMSGIGEWMGRGLARGVVPILTGGVGRWGVM